MDRRTLLASLGAAAACPARADEAPAWSAPVIDMHFHMRRTPDLDNAHQVGAGITAANLLTAGTVTDQVHALQAQNPARFPVWFHAADVTRPEAEAQ